MRERLQLLLNRRPFRPFRLHLSSGIQHVIAHPEQAMIIGSYLDIATRQTTGHLAIDSVFVSLIHVVQLEPLPPTPSATLNGKQSN